jgi:hypothetical protein
MILYNLITAITMTNFDMKTIAGRVVRRYSTYSQFYFLQVVWPGLSEDSIFPVIVRTDSDKILPRVRPGDVVRISGQMIDHVSEFYSNRCFEADSVEVIESWDNKTMGVFEFTVMQPRGEKAHNISIYKSSKHLGIAIQCQVDVIDRVDEYMRLIYGVRDSGITIRRSVAASSLGNDRLLLVEHEAVLGEEALHEFATKLIGDPVLTYVIKRIYIFPPSSTVTGVTLEETLKNLLSQEGIREAGKVCRIHGYPKNIDMSTIGRVLLPTYSFHPKSFSSVLNIAFIDGFYFASAVPKTVAVACGDHICEFSSTDSLNVSKAAAKIREALVRLGDRARIEGKECIDVGASPGGWSYYLKTEKNAARVVAVDMGKLADPIPNGVEHWRMKGQEAISDLLRQKSYKQFYLYACDMNCDPLDSVTLFIEALPLMADESWAVITLKRTERNKQRWEELKIACKNKLSEKSHDIESIHEVHLIANTPNETTLLIEIRRN